MHRHVPRQVRGVVPGSWLGEDACRETLTVFNTERITVAMLGVGAIYELCMRYVRNARLSVDRSRGSSRCSTTSRNYLADMCVNLENARNLTYKAAWLCESGQPYHLEVTMAKLVAAEGARHAGIYGPEIFGGYGICSEYPVSIVRARRVPRSSSHPYPTR